MHPQSTAAATAAEPPHNKRRLGRSRTTNDVSFLPKQPPGPFAQARRRRDLVEVFLSALGGEQACSELTLVAVRRCAELQAMCEMARASMLNGVPTDMLALVRLEGVAARAIRGLGIKYGGLGPEGHAARLAAMDARAKAANEHMDAVNQRLQPGRRRGHSGGFRA